MRQIIVPGLKESELKLAVNNNDSVLLSHCSKRQPKYGTIMSYGIMWSSFEDFQKDAEESCHYFYQLYVFTYRESVYAPSHADEIYNMRINPYTLQPLS
jgi:hypothetical protein